MSAICLAVFGFSFASLCSFVFNSFWFLLELLSHSLRYFSFLLCRPSFCLFSFLQTCPSLFVLFLLKSPLLWSVPMNKKSKRGSKQFQMLLHPFWKNEESIWKMSKKQILILLDHPFHLLLPLLLRLLFLPLPPPRLHRCLLRPS